MLRKTADAPDHVRWASKIFFAGRDSLGTAARDASDRAADLSYETIKITTLRNGPLTPHGADQKHPAFLRSIRVNPPSWTPTRPTVLDA